MICSRSFTAAGSFLHRSGVGTGQITHLSDVWQSTIRYSVRELSPGGLRLGACVEKSSLADFGRLCVRQGCAPSIFGTLRLVLEGRSMAYELTLPREE